MSIGWGRVRAPRGSQFGQVWEPLVLKGEVAFYIHHAEADLGLRMSLIGCEAEATDGVRHGFELAASRQHVIS